MEVLWKITVNLAVNALNYERTVEPTKYPR